MTQAVPTAGFIVPPAVNPAPAATPPIQPPQGTQPTNGLAGMVPSNPSADPTQAAPAAQPAAQGGGDPALAAAIAALTAALQPKPGSTPQAGPDVPAAPNAPATGDLNSVDVAGLDDPILRSMALAMRAGAETLDMNRVMGLAIERGDPALIDRAYLIEKLGKDAVHRIQIAEGIVASVNEKAQRSASLVYESAGGKEQWGAAAAAFNKGAPEALKAVVVNMLDSGNTDQIGAASKLVVEFAKGQGFIPNSNPLLSAGAAPTSGQALSKADFQLELRKLDPQSRDFQDKRAELFARRTLGKQLGK